MFKILLPVNDLWCNVSLYWLECSLWSHILLLLGILGNSHMSIFIFSVWSFLDKLIYLLEMSHIIFLKYIFPCRPVKEQTDWCPLRHLSPCCLGDTKPISQLYQDHPRQHHEPSVTHLLKSQVNYTHTHFLKCITTNGSLKTIMYFEVKKWQSA